MELGSRHVGAGTSKIMNGKEEIEAANLAKRKRGGDQEAPALKCLSWKQTEQDVSIVLEAQAKLSASDLDPEFTETLVKISLKEGSSWQCTFNQEIEPKATQVGLQGSKVMIKVKKKQPNQHWPTLEVGRSANGKSGEDTEPLVNGERIEHGDKEKEKDESYKLSHVKHDWFEKGLDILVVHIYVKQIHKDSVKINYEDRKLFASFTTCDPKFLSLHIGTDENTVFSWSVDVVDSLRTEACKYRVTGAFIELMLAKKEPRRWCALEASQVKGGNRESKTTRTAHSVASATASASSSAWVPAKKNALNSRTKGITTTDQSKVMFDEMVGDTNKTEKVKRATPTVVPEKENRPISSKVTQKSNKMLDNNKEATSQKPTCMVSPLNKNLADRPQVVSKGMTGLDNLGNTCFQNSVLQVLANTRELRDYFLQSYFQKDINVDNPLGSGGKLAVSFAFLLKVLWSGKHYSYAPAKLKNLVAMKASQFTGFAQHDAQEFMAFLLDGLHEDLNRVRDKPYTQTVDSDGRPDEVVANEAWEVHKKRNNSFIVDLFQGQYKSKLVCPHCGKVSITFDPFMILPVPLPKKQRLLPVIFMWKDPYKKPVKYMLRLPRDATVEQLKDAISLKTTIHQRDLRVFESYKHGVHTFFGKGSSLSNVSATDKIFVCEVLSERVAGEPVVELVLLQRVLVPLQVASRCSFCHRECAADKKLRRCARCYRTAYCDHTCQKKDWSRHRPMCRSLPAPVGEPFIVSLPESQATYSRLAQMAEIFSRYSVDVFQPPVTEDNQSPASPAASVSTPVATVTSPVSDSDFDVTPTKSVCSSLSSGLCVWPSGSVTEVESPDILSLASDHGDSGVDSLSTATSSSISSASGQLERLDSPEKDTDTASLRSNLEKPLLSGSGDSVISTPPTGYILGHQQNMEYCCPPFYLKPVDKDGRSLNASTPEGQRLEDKGDQPLDLASTYFLAMDWKNSEKLQPYVMVQSKPLDYEEHSSIHTASAEENTTITLDQCLSLFTEPEVLSPEHAWYCPSCKEHREATKQLSIWRLPNTLIIQLKRFSFRNLLWRDKIDKLVSFNTRGLDMGQFYIGNRPSNEPPPIYDLYGVINHHGDILGGHYTAYGRCPDPNNSNKNELGWRLFDDSRVSITSEKQVVTSAAYVLFYRRRSFITNVPANVSPTNADVETGEVGEEPEEKLDAKDKESQSHCEISDTEDGAYSMGASYGPLSLDNKVAYASSAFTDMDTVD